MLVPRIDLSSPRAGLSSAMRAAVCRAWLGMEAVIEQSLGKTLAARPYRMFLFELYLAELEQTSLFQSCFAVGEAPANAHRRAARLADLGALIRAPDRNDHRRTDLRLAPTVKTALNRIIGETIHLERTLRAELREKAEPRKHTDSRDGQRQRPATVGSRTPDLMSMHKDRLMAGGLMRLPTDLRKALGFDEGSTMLMSLEDGEIRIRSAGRVLRLIQQRLRPLSAPGRSPSETLIAERRTQVSRD
ncbi:MAG: AbrB/MazE/SpoVT family DNA-binding domain-containing protein [Sphingomonadales bacterium]|nr:AbrB/MazE/SpoVT family DNA-binding domain-containing protein [Sphingomonadales bacterium]MDE2169408.1 AbrB/MazE/SpoVT family DNA-binding domain-containing protein [Sphingomonadales bacterium]